MFKHSQIHISSYAVSLVLALLLVGCSLIPSPAPSASPVAIAGSTRVPSETPPLSIITITLPPTSAPAITSTPCSPAYTWAYGTVTPAFAQQVQQALDSTGLTGQVETSTYGETDGCGHYGAMSVDYQFTVTVMQLNNSQELGVIAAQILKIATSHVGPESAPNLGKLQLTFQANGQSCIWHYSAGAWSLNTATSAEQSAVCATPPAT